MASVHPDVMELGGSYENGTWTKLTRLARVTGLSDSDPTILRSALDACAAATPALTVGSNLTSLGYPANLILKKLEPRLVDKCVVDVTLEYAIDTRSQGLAGLAFGFLIPEIDTSLVQATSYTDVNGEPITVSHVYPTSDPRFGEDATTEERTKTKRVSVQAMQPQFAVMVRQIREARHPEQVALAINGKVNLTAWYNGEAREWLCTGVKIDQQSASASPPTFAFTFMFQKKVGGHDPVAVFLDDQTGVAPDGLVDDVGIKNVRVHEAVDFEQILEARIYNG